MPARKPDEFVEAQQPFSELMLRWLAEGDAHETAAADHEGSTSTRQDGSTLRSARFLGRTRESQRHRVLLGSAALISLGLILVVRRYGAQENGADQANADVSVALPRTPDPAPVNALSVHEKPSPEPKVEVTRVEPESGPTPEIPPSGIPEPSAVVAVAEPAARPPISPEPEQRNPVRDCRAAVARESARAALRECAVAVEAAPHSAAALVLLARANLLGGHEGETLRLAQQALTIDSRLSEAYLLVGSVEQTNGHPENARSAYETYLRLSPTGRHAADVRAVLQTL